ncbi:MAG: septum formation family protein [Kibdelosporangium sp.]
MSTNAERFRSRRRTLSTRLVMAGAFVGALLILTFSMVFSWPVGLPATAEDQAAQNLAAAFEAPAGSCLTWKPDGADMRTTSCDEPHLFEVTGDVDITNDYGESAQTPTDDAWREIAKQRCTTDAAAYIGGKLDPFGRFSVGALKPSADQWADGDRKLRCGLQRAAPSGKVLIPTKGKAQGQDQSDVYEPGTCLALEGKTVGDPVDCSGQKAHAYEIIGVVNLKDIFKDGSFPLEEQQQSAMLDQCPKIAAEYTGGLDLASKKLTLTWDTRKQESWDAGSHLAACKVGAPLEDNSGLAPVSGSVKAVGAQPSAPPPPASGTPGG